MVQIQIDEDQQLAYQHPHCYFLTTHTHGIHLPFHFVILLVEHPDLKNNLKSFMKSMGDVFHLHKKGDSLMCETDRRIEMAEK